MDHLLGLKENVIIGKQIPAGTGLTAYRKVAEELIPQVEPETPDQEDTEPAPEAEPAVEDSAEDTLL